MKRTLIALFVALWPLVACAQTVQNTFGIKWNANNTMAVSPANTGSIRYNSATQKFEQSLNGGAYTGLGSATLAQTYANGTVAADQTMSIAAGNGGPIIVKANGAATGDLLLVEDSSANKIADFPDNAAVSFKVGTATGGGGTDLMLAIDTINDCETGTDQCLYRFRNFGRNLFNFVGQNGVAQITMFDASQSPAINLGTLQVMGSSPYSSISVTGADGANAIAFRVNTTNAFSSAGTKHLSLQNAGTEVLGFSVATSGSCTVECLNGDGSSPFAQLSQTFGTKIGYTNNYLGANLNVIGLEFFVGGASQFAVVTSEMYPVTDLNSSYGDSTHRLNNVWSAAHDGVGQSVGFSATPNFNCTAPNGETVKFGPVTGNVTGATMTSGSPGQLCVVDMLKDNTAGTYTIAFSGTNVRAQTGVAFTSAANSVVSFAFRWNDQLATPAWVQVSAALTGL